jgi:hypothetical protein
MQTDMFFNLVDRKLIEVLPDIVDLPQVHVDAAVLFIYYGILYLGCELHGVDSGVYAGRDYSRLLYLGCLRALPGWQREATGSTTDFAAALFMVFTRSNIFCMVSISNVKSVSCRRRVVGSRLECQDVSNCMRICPGS